MTNYLILSIIYYFLNQFTKGHQKGIPFWWTTERKWVIIKGRKIFFDTIYRYLSFKRLFDNQNFRSSGKQYAIQVIQAIERAQRVIRSAQLCHTVSQSCLTFTPVVI